MGVRILSDRETRVACLYDSVSDIAFGPVFYGLDASEAGEEVDYEEMAEGFLAYLEQNARTYSEADLAYQYDCYRNAIELSGWAEVREEVKL